MNSVRRKSRVVLIGVISLLLLLGYIFASATQTLSSPNKITFDNQSGQNTVVKLIGPTYVVSRLARDQKRTVRVSKGDYYVLVRYGNSPKEYSYTKSALFSVDQPDGQISIITFTLHRRSGGSFQSHLVSGDEFEGMDKTNMETPSP